MQRNDVVKGVFIAVPLAVLCLLYGLWLVMDTPVYVESMLVGGLVLLLFALLFVQFVPRAFDFVMGADQEQLPSAVQRTSTVGVREILRLVLLLRRVLLRTKANRNTMLSLKMQGHKRLRSSKLLKKLPDWV